MSDNDIDKKITEVSNDDLDGVKSSLDHINELDDDAFSELQDKLKEMLDDLDKDSFKKAGKFIVDLSREEE